ncbi:MAG: GntR family transcriptional regulator [Actinobacteria bacterium]|jgi:GntR family transcriptional regulator|nr:GntR family transcriptional regulator [Actinomycetota bacterium]
MARTSRKPKHVELSEKLTNRFAKLKPHSQIPSARQLSSTYGVSTMTIRQALSSLQSDGLIYTIPGSGTYVSGEKLSKRLVFVSFSEEIREKGMKPSSKILKAERVEVTNKKLANILQIPVGDAAYRIMRVRLADGLPLAIEDTFVPCDNAPGLLDQDLKTSLYEIFKNVYEKPVVRADSAVSPILLDKQQAGILKAPVNTPSLMFTLTAFDMRGRTMEHCVSIKRGDKYDFKFSIQA